MPRTETPHSYEPPAVEERTPIAQPLIGRVSQPT